MLAPIVAACGAFVPMISGRGLGHTGGTLDKLSAIPGYDDRSPTSRPSAGSCARSAAPSSARPTISRRPTAGSMPCATSPRRSNSIPLIVSSILSKKLAAGLDGLVMDVKFGSGAFCDTEAMARDLARKPGRRRQPGRPAHGRADHRHGPRAGPQRRQCAGGRRGRRLPEGRRHARPAPARGDDGAGRRDAGARRPGAQRRGRPGARRGGAGRRARGGESSPAWWRRSAGRTTSSSISGRYLARAPVIKPCTAERLGPCRRHERPRGRHRGGGAGRRPHPCRRCDRPLGRPERGHRCRRPGPRRQPALPRPCRQRRRCRRGDRHGAPRDPHRRCRTRRPGRSSSSGSSHDAPTSQPRLAIMRATASWCCTDFLSAADCDALQARAAELVAGFDPGPARTIFSTRDQGHARDRYFLRVGRRHPLLLRGGRDRSAGAAGAEQDRPCAARPRSGVRPHLAPARGWPALARGAGLRRSRCCCSRCTSSSSRRSAARSAGTRTRPICTPGRSPSPASGSRSTMPTATMAA